MSAVLLDTHALSWFVMTPDKLGREAARIIERAHGSGELQISAFSFWEIAMHVDRGKMKLNLSPELWRAQVLGLGIQEIPLDGQIAIRAAGLMSFHADPADRFIAATAQFHDATLVTADHALLGWRTRLKRQDARK